VSRYGFFHFSLLSASILSVSVMTCAEVLPAENIEAVPPARSIPGLTTVDPYPEGCVGCHINMPELGIDARLSTVLQQLTEQVPPPLLAIARKAVNPDTDLIGRHPPVPFAIQDIPRACILCHGSLAGTAPVFSRLMHLIHMSGGDNNHFLTRYQGECTLCHKLDLNSGIWSLPSHPEP